MPKKKKHLTRQEKLLQSHSGTAEQVKHGQITHEDNNKTDVHSIQANHTKESHKEPFPHPRQEPSHPLRVESQEDPSSLSFSTAAACDAVSITAEMAPSDQPMTAYLSCPKAAMSAAASSASRW